MAEAEHTESGGGPDGIIIILVIIVFIGLWLRGGGWGRFIHQQVNFGWARVSSSSSPFPFAPNFASMAPHVPIPSPTGPQGPDPYAH